MAGEAVEDERSDDEDQTSADEEEVHDDEDNETNHDETPSLSYLPVSAVALDYLQREL